MTATTTIEHTVRIDAAPATVYELWTTAEGLCAWWGVAAAIDPWPGGAIRVDIDGEHIMVGEVTDVDPPHRLHFTFGWEGGDPAPGTTAVDVVIDETDTGSQLTLRHHGLPIELIESHARGWTHFLGDRLAAAER